MDSFLAYWSKIRGRTRRVLDVIPPERIEWTFRDGKWTLGDLIRHIAALEALALLECLLEH